MNRRKNILVDCHDLDHGIREGVIIQRKYIHVIFCLHYFFFLSKREFYLFARFWFFYIEYETFFCLFICHYISFYVHIEIGQAKNILLSYFLAVNSISLFHLPRSLWSIYYKLYSVINISKWYFLQMSRYAFFGFSVCTI